MVKHLVFGAGLIGCYLGAALMAQGHNVRLLCRKRVADQLSQGIKLTDYTGNDIQLAPPDCIDQDTAQGEQCDVIWLTVKCTGVADAIPQLKAVVQPDTRIYCCQNGLGSEQAVKAAFPDNEVRRVMVPFNVVELAPGHFHRGSEGALTLEALSADEVTFADALNCAILPVSSTENMSALLWAKLQLNLGNSVNALADIPVKAMLENRGYRLLIAAMMDELLAVTHAKGVELPKVTALPGPWLPSVLRLPDWLFKRVANKMLAIDPNVRTSMWWDLSQGKTTEVDFINGAIVAEGEKLGLACPVNKAMVSLIHQVEQGRQSIGMSAEALTQALKR